MKLANEFLGFAVLTSPLWLILVLVAVALSIAIPLAKRTKHGVGRAAIGIFVFAVLVLLPFGDAILGSMYLRHLCATEAGVRVHKTVQLPEAYWDREGRPTFLLANGSVDMKLLPNRFEWQDVRERHVDSIVRIDKWRWQLRDRSSLEIMGERITFLRYFGWIERLSPAPNIGESCRDLGGEISRDESERSQALLRGIFLPERKPR